jgi:hypothetical protein
MNSGVMRYIVVGGGIRARNGYLTQLNKASVPKSNQQFHSK